MPDNVGISTGSDATIATDDIGGKHHQRVKVQHGADGTATDVSGASPLPVDSELPAAAALTNDNPNPTAPIVGAAGLQWHGTGWTRDYASSGTVELLAAADRVGNTGTPLQAANARGVWLELVISAAGAGDLTFRLRGPSSSAVAKICEHRFVAPTSRAYLLVYPGINPADHTASGFFQGAAKSLVLPRFWSVDVIPSDGAATWNYALNAFYLK